MLDSREFCNHIIDEVGVGLEGKPDLFLFPRRSAEDLGGQVFTLVFPSVSLGKYPYCKSGA